LAKLAEEIAQDPEIEKNAASLSIDSLAKTFAQQKGRLPSVLFPFHSADLLS